GTVTLHACAVGPTPASGFDRGPYTLSLDCGGVSPQIVNTSTDGTACADFNVAVNGPMMCTLTVTDRFGCTRTAPISLSASPVAKPLLSAGTPDCTGKVTYTISNCDSTLTYAYKEVNCTTGAVVGTLSGGGKGV